MTVTPHLQVQRLSFRVRLGDLRRVTQKRLTELAEFPKSMQVRMTEHLWERLKKVFLLSPTPTCKGTPMGLQNTAESILNLLPALSLSGVSNPYFSRSRSEAHLPTSPLSAALPEAPAGMAGNTWLPLPHPVGHQASTAGGNKGRPERKTQDVTDGFDESTRPRASHHTLCFPKQSSPEPPAV